MALLCQLLLVVSVVDGSVYVVQESAVGWCPWINSCGKTRDAPDSDLIHWIRLVSGTSDLAGFESQ